MNKLERIEEPMSLTEIAARASYQVVLTGEGNVPVGVGSGCIAYYKNRLFFLTVAHVTNINQVAVTLELNKPPIDGMVQNYCVGGMNYFDLYDVSEAESLVKQGHFNVNQLDEIETIDFAFAELTEMPEAYQLEANFEHHGTVPKCTKIVIPEAQFDTEPSSDEKLLFCGAINGDYRSGVLSRQQKLTVECEYLEEYDSFYKLKLPQPINDPAELEGTSGAPVFDTIGNFIGLVSFGFEDEPENLYVFKNSEIKRLIGYFIAANPTTSK
jgi:hypothetical protein